MQTRELIINKNSDPYIFLTGSFTNFVAYNTDSIRLTDEQILPDDLTQYEYYPNLIIDELKSDVWSANCKCFFVVQNGGVFLFNVHDNIAWFCSKKSTNFIHLFLNSPIL